MSNESSNPKILVVDDEEHIREILAVALQKVSSDITTAGSAEEALEMIKDTPFDLVLSDIRMPGIDGLEFLKIIKEEQPWLLVVLMTAHGNMDLVIEALRFGAADFINKPFNNQAMRESIKKALYSGSKQRVKSTPSHSIVNNQKVFGDSPPFVKVMNTGLKASKSNANILILGQSGTGKEVMARTIHQNSSSSKGPFIPVNCGAIPENLIESELFGHEKGAFTGALQAKPGKFELAQGGTLFLDEIGEMPLLLQVKLLRVLQEKCIERIGGTQPISLDFRLIAATHNNLEDSISTGSFREDLFYRLNVIPLHLPSLKERGNDAIILAQGFLDRHNKRLSNNFEFTSEQLKGILNFEWPGNIRQLENTIERAVVLGDENGLFFDSVFQVTKQNDTPDKEVSNLKLDKQKAEKESILLALEENRWNKTKTADSLGISRRSLLYKVKAYNIS